MPASLASRCVEREWLDVLPPADPRAMRSRRDLRRVNAIMRNASIAAQALVACVRRPPGVVVELGAGDGAWLLQLAHALPVSWSGLRAVLLDRQDSVSGGTLGALAMRGWTPEVVNADALEWLARPGPGVDVVVANLFLHHFDAEPLSALLALVARRCKVFVACEPRRSGWALQASRLLVLAGCNEVTRHDAVVSVRAGFSGSELTALWPQSAQWRVEETGRGAFSHLFVAARTSEVNAA